MSFANNDMFDAVIGLLTPYIPTYKEYAIQTQLPFARLVELGETYEYFTRSGNQLNVVHQQGTFQISVFHTHEHECRNLRRQIMVVMDNANLIYSTGRIMHIEPISSRFIPEPSTVPGSPTVFHCAITIGYDSQRTL